MVNQKYSHLFRNIKIGDNILPNRIVMAPMNEGNSTNSEYVERTSIDYYGARAKGGAGMIITDCFTVTSKKQDPYSGEKRLYPGMKIYTLAEIAREISLYGSVPAIQFSPGLGATYQGEIDPGNPPADVSPMPCKANPEIMCREMTAEEIQMRVKAFGDAAEMAWGAGYKACNLNSHGGYLFPRFLSPKVNRRTDEYGGSAENRFRFLKEVIQEIKSRVDGKMGVILRLSLERLDYLETSLEESLKYCRLAEEAGADMLDVDAGSTDREVMYFYPTMHLGKTPLAAYTRAVKQVVNIPVAAVGGYLHPDEAEKMLENGSADLVYLGRPLLADPEWALKAKQGRTGEIRPCIQCMERCVDNISAGRRLGCAVNPRCGFEYRNYPETCEKKKKVIVVGAGPGGITAALTAAKRGHEVQLLEKQNRSGGQILEAAKEEFKWGMQLYLKYLEKQLELHKIKVRYGCRATVEILKSMEPDVVIAAAGAVPQRLEIPGIEKTLHFTVEDFPMESVCEGEKILVVGAGMVGCEAALGLARKGCCVTLIARSTSLAKGCSTVNRISVLDALEKERVPILTETKCCEIREEGEIHFLVCENAEGKKELPFDKILEAIGQKPEDEWIKYGEENFREFYAIGDCVKVGKVADAVEQGFYTGLRI